MRRRSWGVSVSTRAGAGWRAGTIKTICSKTGHRQTSSGQGKGPRAFGFPCGRLSCMLCFSFLFQQEILCCTAHLRCPEKPSAQPHTEQRLQAERHLMPTRESQMLEGLTTSKNKNPTKVAVKRYHLGKGGKKTHFKAQHKATAERTSPKEK